MIEERHAAAIGLAHRFIFRNHRNQIKVSLSAELPQR